MSGARDKFLERVRQAVMVGQRPGGASPHPGPWSGPRQTGEGDLAEQFAERLRAVGGACHLVKDGADALTVIDQLLTERKARQIVVGRGPYVDQLGLSTALRGTGRQWRLIEGEVESEEAAESPHKRHLFAADVGITGVEWLIAETGSVVLASRPGQARSLSLLPPVHVAVAHRSQILGDLFDFFDRIEGRGKAPNLPACWNLITGPSKTGDIELKLVTGVHGPGEVHVVTFG